MSGSSCRPHFIHATRCRVWWSARNYDLHRLSYQQQRSKVTEIRHTTLIIWRSVRQKFACSWCKECNKKTKTTLNAWSCSSGRRASEYCSPE